ncbi:MAG: S41 family peptidase [Nitrospira sp. SB0661_bin_20]|nr:S41 family peptidase [Nitrospira sp. SB0661_bin_20]MYJ22958.1 S41 family peptidase [Nitrospira sp. SB0673_bin_12]
MEKERSSFTWVSGLVVVGALVLGLLIGKGVEKTGYAGESYEELKIFAEVLTQVKKHYVEEVQMDDLVHGAVRGMLKTLDPHSAYMTPEMYKEMRVETKGEFEGLGIQIGIKDHHVTVIAPIEGTPAHAAGIETGDVILKVDDTSTKDLTLMEAVQRMRGPKGTSVTLTVRREGAPDVLSFTLVRDTIKIQSVRSRLLDDHIGYVRISQFQESTPQDLGKELVKLHDDGTQGLILDLRNNPGGLLSSAVGVSEQFLQPDTLVVSVKGRDGRKDEYRSNPPMGPPEYPMIVLVNQGSASASEIVAAAMQDWGKAVILGKTTFGKGSVQTILPLSDGSGLRLTTAKYYTPSGESIHSVGVKPDIVVEPKPIAADEEPKELPSPEADAGSSSESDADAEKPQDLEAELMKKDVQLQKAIELLKTWKVFKDLHPLESGVTG